MRNPTMKVLQAGLIPANDKMRVGTCPECLLNASGDYVILIAYRLQGHRAELLGS
jgi:hypothetical protein